MKISPMTKVSTLKDKFKEEFGVEIKCHKGMSKGHMAEDDAKVHEICTGMEVDRDFEIELNGHMLVSTAENEVAESLGFKVQILNPDGSNADNGSTLASLKRDY